MGYTESDLIIPTLNYLLLNKIEYTELCESKSIKEAVKNIIVYN